MGQDMGQSMGQAGQPGSAEPEERAQGRSGVQAGMGRRQEQGEAATPRSSGAETPGRHSRVSLLLGHTLGCSPGTHTHTLVSPVAGPARAATAEGQSRLAAGHQAGGRGSRGCPALWSHCQKRVPALFSPTIAADYLPNGAISPCLSSGHQQKKGDIS